MSAPGRACSRNAQRDSPVNQRCRSSNQASTTPQTWLSKPLTHSSGTVDLEVCPIREPCAGHALLSRMAVIRAVGGLRPRSGGSAAQPPHLDRDGANHKCQVVRGECAACSSTCSMLPSSTSTHTASFPAGSQRRSGARGSDRRLGRRGSGWRLARAQDDPCDPGRRKELDHMAGEPLLKDEVHENKDRNQQDRCTRDCAGAPQGHRHPEQAEEAPNQEHDDHRDRGRNRQVWPSQGPVPNGLNHLIMYQGMYL